MAPVQLPLAVDNPDWLRAAGREQLDAGHGSLLYDAVI